MSRRRSDMSWLVPMPSLVEYPKTTVTDLVASLGDGFILEHLMQTAGRVIREKLHMELLSVLDQRAAQLTDERFVEIKDLVALRTKDDGCV